MKDYTQAELNAMTEEEFEAVCEEDEHGQPVLRPGVQAITHDLDLNVNDLRIVMTMLWFTSDGGWIWLPNKAVSFHSGLGLHAVSATIRKLKSKGYICRKRHSKYGRVSLRWADNIADNIPYPYEEG